MESITSTYENPRPATNAGPSSSGASNYHFDRTSTAQFNSDAQLLSEFEESVASGESFDYVKSIPRAPQAMRSNEKITGYLSKIQRGSLVQSVGCTIAVEPHFFQILAYSKNCFEMLGVPDLFGPGLLGSDARKIFTPSSATSLSKAVGCRNLSFLNPILVQSRTNHKAFYAILHRIDVGILIDLELVQAGHPSGIQASAVGSQKIALKAISKLKSLRGGSVRILCNTMVKEIQKITGYDRVMVYKFHEDNHGEVISEFKRTDLVPYLGVHYPATDIPQAARFLFKQNRVRMICDCNSEPVRIVQSPDIVQPLCLVSSIFRAPHACHVEYMINMGSIASLVLAIIFDDVVDSSTRLWGLVVCHHTSPRQVLFPLRYACRFVVQTFSLQLRQELLLADQLAEKRTFLKQTILCDMLLHNAHAPHVIITMSPSIMDLVKCNGAALYYKGQSWCRGVTPDESRVKDIVGWLMMTRGEWTRMSTECLVEAGYPGAVALGDAVCGMVAARINSAAMLFWFRSHTAKEVKWGGARHQSEDEDDCEKMNPRTSFNTFLEVAKSRSLPWEAGEIRAIDSLQLQMRDSITYLEVSSVMDEQKQLLEPSFENI